MRKIDLFIFCLACSLSLVSCSGHKELQIKGAWKWVSIKYLSGDSVKWQKASRSEDEGGIKMWSDDYFVCVYRFKNDTSYDYSYSGGKYELNGNRYEETIVYHDQINIPELVGIKEMMLLEMNNDTLVQIYPVDEKGKPIANHFVVIEKFVRLDSLKKN